LCERAVTRFAIVVALVACKTHVIDLDRADAAIDARIAVCECRIPCPASTAAECALISGASCGSDHYCTSSLGACTSATSSPCGGSASPTSVCRDVTAPGNVCQ